MATHRTRIVEKPIFRDGQYAGYVSVREIERVWKCTYCAGEEYHYDWVPISEHRSRIEAAAAHNRWVAEHPIKSGLLILLVPAGWLVAVPGSLAITFLGGGWWTLGSLAVGTVLFSMGMLGIEDTYA